jgi:hypothetical protein
MESQNELKDFGNLNIVYPQHLRSDLFTFWQEAKDLMSWSVERSSYNAKIWNIWEGQLFVDSWDELFRGIRDITIFNIWEILQEK